MKGEENSHRTRNAREGEESIARRKINPSRERGRKEKFGARREKGDERRKEEEKRRAIGSERERKRGEEIERERKEGEGEKEKFSLWFPPYGSNFRREKTQGERRKRRRRRE